MTEAEKEREALAARPPICRDHDEDCDDVPDKVHCWLYDPAKGRCPFLSFDHHKGTDREG